MPDGYRMVVTSAPRGGGLAAALHPLAGGAPSWEWRYAMDAGGDVACEFVRNAALDLLFPRGGLRPEGEEEPMVLDFII